MNGNFSYLKRFRLLYEFCFEAHIILIIGRSCSQSLMRQQASKVSYQNDYSVFQSSQLGLLHLAQQLYNLYEKTHIKGACYSSRYSSSFKRCKIERRKFRRSFGKSFASKLDKVKRSCLASVNFY